MEQKINVAELLKDCPSGMELDCTICDNLYFNEVTPYMIRCYIKNDETYNSIYFHHDGSYLTCGKAKCVIFPKGKTTWKGFQRPFKDGDILTTEKGSIFIYKGPAYYNKLLADFYCGYTIFDKFTPYNFKDKHFGDISECRFATEEEKQKLFDAIKTNGYKWNEETKTLEKIKKEYPKTYEECCKLLSLGEDGRLYTKGYKASLIQNLQILLICRNAYWKIAGEEMGLDKHWEPDWTDLDQLKYCIWVDVGEFISMANVRCQHILAFPTEEIRDAFYVNFKKEIEMCKELL
jgi:hypothetical protein